MNRLPVLAVFLLSALPFHAEPSSQTEAPMIKEYTPADKAIETTVGQTFVIKLVSNPSTGYEWQLEKALDAKVISLVSNTFVPKKQENRLVGSGGHELWTFMAEGQGKAEIAFKYVRPWETDVPATMSNTFAVSVK